MAGLSATARTLRALRAKGVVCDISERFVAGGSDFGHRRDLFGFIDIVALTPIGVMGIQSTTGQQIPAHKRKIDEDRAQQIYDWLRTPGTLCQIWGWRKIKRKNKDGKLSKAEIWKARVIDVTLDSEGFCIFREQP